MKFKLSLSTDKFVDVILKSLNADEVKAFKVTFAAQLADKLLLQEPITEKDYASALCTAVSFHGLKTRPDLLGPLLDVLFQNVKPINTGKINLNTSKVMPVSNKLNNDKQKAKKTAAEASSNKKTSTALPVPYDECSVRAKTRVLSKQTHDKMKQILLGKANNSVIFSKCKTKHCTQCKELLFRIPLTKCTHDKPCNDVGLFPHVSRSTLNKLHNNMQLALSCSVKHWLNPMMQPAIKMEVEDTENRDNNPVTQKEITVPDGCGSDSIENRANILLDALNICECGSALRETRKGHNRYCVNFQCSKSVSNKKKTAKHASKKRRMTQTGSRSDVGASPACADASQVDQQHPDILRLRTMVQNAVAYSHMFASDDEDVDEC